MSMIHLTEEQIGEHGKGIIVTFSLIFGVLFLYTSVGMAGTHILLLQILGCPLFILSFLLLAIPFNLEVTKW
jgi:hypothetical protein